MQVHEIRRITNKIKRKSEIEAFIESELFIKEFPLDLKEIILKQINESFEKLKKSLFQALKIILLKYSNQDLISKTAEFFQKPISQKPKPKKIFLTEKEIDDFEQLKSDLNDFFLTIKDSYALKDHLIIGWNEFCVNQGITREIPLNPKIINIFKLNEIPEEEFDSPTYNILDPIYNFFNILDKEDIASLLIGNSVWKLSIDYFNKITRYKVMPHNGALIILTYYEGILVVMKTLRICKNIQDVNTLAKTYYNISQYEECINFIIEPWREIF